MLPRCLNVCFCCVFFVCLLFCFCSRGSSDYSELHTAVSAKFSREDYVYELSPHMNDSHMNDSHIKSLLGFF